MPLGTALFGFLYRADREQAMRQIAEAGYRLLEISAVPPFVDLTDVSAEERRRIFSELERYDLECVSVNPVELNPISTNSELSAACYHQYRTAIELTAELGGESIVLITGRRNPLIPAPEAMARGLLRNHLARLAPVARRLGVTICLETVPYGFLQTAAELAQFIEESGIDGSRNCARLRQQLVRQGRPRGRGRRRRRAPSDRPYQRLVAGSVGPYAGRDGGDRSGGVRRRARTAWIRGPGDLRAGRRRGSSATAARRSRAAVGVGVVHVAPVA